MIYQGDPDLIQAAIDNPYVPQHLKYKANGKYLAVRRR